MRARHLSGLLAGAAVAFSVAALTTSHAAPLATGAATLQAAAPNNITEVQWRRRHYHHHHHHRPHHRRWGWAGAGAGFAAGLALGALAARPYYYDPYYYYGPPPAYYDLPPVVYYEAPPARPYIDPHGPVRQCWVATDRDRGYGYYVPC